MPLHRLSNTQKQWHLLEYSIGVNYMPLNGIFLLLGLYSKPIDFFLNDSEYLTVGAAKADREI